jgi:chromate transport protein ChrA
MYIFSLGVSRIEDRLPGPVYGLLSGLNAATVGIIALAATQLTHKVITDKYTRALVFLGAAAGMLYTALWYLPVLMIAAGIVTIMWDLRIVQNISRNFYRRRRDNSRTPEIIEARTGANEDTIIGRAPVASPPRSIRHIEEGTTSTTTNSVQLRRLPSTYNVDGRTMEPDVAINLPPVSPLLPESHRVLLSWRLGVLVLILFFLFFLTLMLIRGLYHSRPRVLSLFANLYLAGTIIFGGGPVVIPLLRDYIVAEGWVSPRDFLLGLALIQAFPGPNFNFAVYLGALAVSGTRTPSIIGALVAFLGIFIPGLVVQSGFMGLWAVLPKNRVILSALRGINAAAVGLVFTAVYRIWQIGYLDQSHQSGQPLGGDPWWVVVTATSYVGGSWFGLSPPATIVLGGVMGLVWYVIVHH